MIVQEKKPQPEVDYGRLASFFGGLSAASRIELLRKLQIPHALSDITLHPTRKAKGRAHDRPLTRGAVEAHIRVLLDLGLVEESEGERDGRRVTEYIVDHAGLFRFTEEVRSLSLIRPARGPSPGVTQPGEVIQEESSPLDTPALVLVSGPLEGTHFPLHGDGPWQIGRERGLHVSLPFDPFVSRVNTEIQWKSGDPLLVALPGSRNGTRINWRTVKEGNTVRMDRGDVIGVGRSLLVYQAP